MSTITEIEEAIGRLPVAERAVLESRLLTRRFGLDLLDDRERAELLASLDEADREIDEGSGCSADELREALRSWGGVQEFLPPLRGEYDGGTGSGG